MNNQQSATPQPPDEAGSRSEGLLPTDGVDPNLEIAEEVSLDLQSDSTRRVGSLPPDTPVSDPAAAIAESLSPPTPDGSAPASQSPAVEPDAQLHDAIERAVPPSV